MYVCPWTSVTPATAPRAQPRPTDSTKLYDTTGSGFFSQTRSLDLMLTRTMIDNGGVVILAYYEGTSSSDLGIAFTQWVPVPEIYLSRTTALTPTEEGSRRRVHREPQRATLGAHAGVRGAQ